jgi:hypothetical protein
MSMSPQRAYHEVRDLIRRHGGSMESQPGGPGGGVVWTLELHGKLCRVECRSNSINPLDDLYLANKPVPQTWADYDKPYRLKQDAFWRMIGLPWQ